MPYININRETSRLMQKYASKTGLTLEKAINVALNEWFDVMGSAVVAFAPATRKPKTTQPSPVLYKIHGRSKVAFSPTSSSPKPTHLNT